MNVRVSEGVTETASLNVRDIGWALFGSRYQGAGRFESPKTLNFKAAVQDKNFSVIGVLRLSLDIGRLTTQSFGTNL